VALSAGVEPLSSELYNNAAREFALGQLIWPDTELVLVAWGFEPVFNPAHATIADLRTATGLTELGISLPITDSSVAVDGTCQTNQVVIPNIPIGPDVTWFTLCRARATIELAELILFVDEAIELPFVPNGLDLVIQPDWTLNRGWFRP